MLEWNLIKPILCYYIKDNRPLIIFDINDHCVKKIQALTNKDFCWENKMRRFLFFSFCFFLNGGHCILFDPIYIVGGVHKNPRLIVSYHIQNFLYCMKTNPIKSQQNITKTE